MSTAIHPCRLLAQERHVARATQTRATRTSLPSYPPFQRGPVFATWHRCEVSPGVGTRGTFSFATRHDVFHSSSTHLAGPDDLTRVRRTAVASVAGADSESADVASSAMLPRVMAPINSEEELDEILRQAEEEGFSVVIDWMAQWCRKCIYLRPKVEKLANEYSKVRFYMVDVNAVPAGLVKRGQVTKMPTIQMWKHGKWQAEIIGGHKAWMVIDEIREMLNKPIT